MSAPTYLSYRSDPYGSRRSQRSNHSKLSCDSKASQNSDISYRTIRSTGYDLDAIAEQVQLDVSPSLTATDREQPVSIRSISAHSIASTIKSCFSNLVSCFRTSRDSSTYYSQAEGTIVKKDKKKPKGLTRRLTRRQRLEEDAVSYFSKQQMGYRLLRVTGTLSCFQTCTLQAM